MNHADVSTDDSARSVPADGSSDVGANGSRSDGYLRPGLISYRPRFNPAAIQLLLERLGEQWNDKVYSERLRVYSKDRREFAVMRILGSTLFVLAFSFVMTGGSLYQQPQMVSSLKQLWEVSGPGLVTLAVICIFVLRASTSVKFARMRFFLFLGKAIDQVWQADGRDVKILYLLNCLGIASRALFLALQGSRRTWKAPPMVADRASMLASRLIDFDIPDDLYLDDAASRDALHRFLQDVAAVVVIGREDLLPRVRENYHELPSRSAEDDAKWERDMMYLNPLRDRSRWDVAKDFWYPLAPWLSLLVAIAALAVSLLR